MAQPKDGPNRHAAASPLQRLTSPDWKGPRCSGDKGKATAGQKVLEEEDEEEELSLEASLLLFDTLTQDEAIDLAEWDHDISGA